MPHYTPEYFKKLYLRFAISSTECHDIIWLTGESLGWKHNGKDVKLVYWSNLFFYKCCLMSFSTSEANTVMLASDFVFV